MPALSTASAKARFLLPRPVWIAAAGASAGVHLLTGTLGTREDHPRSPVVVPAPPGAPTFLPPVFHCGAADIRDISAKEPAPRFPGEPADSLLVALLRHGAAECREDSASIDRPGVRGMTRRRATVRCKGEA